MKKESNSICDRAGSANSAFEGGEGRTLPASAYTDEGLFQAECSRIFRHEWLLIGMADHFREPGDYVALNVLGEPIVVLRTKTGTLTALSAVCRHRYMLLLESGRGRMSSLTCPYHNWKYDLEGKLVNAPFMDGVPGFDRASCRLPVFQVEEWQGLVFVNLDPNASPLTARLEGVAPWLTRYHPADTREIYSYDKSWNCNWKLVLENFSESYHHMAVHPQTIEKIAPTWGAYGCDGGPAWAVQRVPLVNKAAHGVTSDVLDTGLLELDRTEMAVLTIFPSTVVNTAGDMFAWASILPEGVGRCRVITGCSASPAIINAGLVDIEANAKSLDKLAEEDERLGPALQRALRSSHTRPGMLSHKEATLSYFYGYLRRLMGATALTSPEVSEV